MNFLLYFWRLPLAATALIVPAWWAAGRIQSGEANPFFRLLLSVGLALLGYVSCVNLLGRLIGNSIVAILIHLLANAIVSVLLLRHRPQEELRPTQLLSTWRSWIGPVLLGFALGLPQWWLGVSSNYWDESGPSGAIQITAPNQFAEGVFPPRHNALPDISIKYHYAFTILSGTTKWLLGVSANVAIDLVSTGLWLFIFLFVYFWFRQLKFDGLTAIWGAFSVLLGGGLAWLYLPRLEAYSELEKSPPASELLHRYDAAKSWFDNLTRAAATPSQHLRNADGSLSNLPWDIAAQFQQHAVSIGIALTLVALYLFAVGQERKNIRWPMLAINITAFSAIFLAHAVFGTVAAVAAGVCMLLAWARQPNRKGLLEGLLFAAGVATLAVLHGGMLATGSQYGAGGFTTMRREFGYWMGGFSGFLHWNIAGFGLPLILAIAALCLHFRRRDPKAVERNILFTALTVFGLFSYMVPQVVFYSSETYGVEQFTEISKFFFCAHFALALLSAFGVAYLQRIRRWQIMIPCFLAAMVSPAIFCYAHSIDTQGAWLGFYRSPYHPNSIEEQMGSALRRLKKTNRDVYFDASADERRHGYVSEMLLFGGSVFTLTPSGFERTGIGFRLSEAAVARRFAQNSRMARLLPGSAEAAGCSWYYCSPQSDLTMAPTIVRSRLAKLIAEGYFVKKFAAGQRVLYAIEKPTIDIDKGIERYWSPILISQTTADCAGDTKGDLIFFDYVAKQILCGQTKIDLPNWSRDEFVNLSIARFPGQSRSSFLIGRLKDTDFRLGKRIDDIIERNPWAWSFLNPRNGQWQSEHDRWFWDWDIPLVADIDHSGFASNIAYRPQSGQWLLAPDKIISGPKVEQKFLPIPFAGRFLKDSRGDLGLWSLGDGMVTLQTVSTGKNVSFPWGGTDGTDGLVFVPGDYDGDGRDEIAAYNKNDLTWYWRRAPDGPIAFAQFGTKTGVPLPWDYNHDGRLDLAYWEPSEKKIRVSLDLGRSVGMIIQVPPYSIPAFVNMH